MFDDQVTIHACARDERYSEENRQSPQSRTRCCLMRDFSAK
jgi:hypothetical protein